nr:polyribonucleotide nucleotidyltransferase-like [Lytechinus pictus]
MKEIKEKFDFNGSPIVVSTGRLAKKADFSVLIEWGETVLLVTTGVGTKPIDRDFLPLSVEFQENLYAAGKIPGSFFRREGRPSQYSVLSARLIDRSIRTLFPKSYRNEVQVIVQPLAVDQAIDIRVPAMLATSIALNAGTSPFSSLVASVNVGYKNGEFVCNPSQKEEGRSDLDLFLTGTEEKINMIEVSANSLSEKDLYAAIEFGFAEIKRLIAFQKSFLKQASRPKVAFEEKKDEAAIAAVEEGYRADIDKIIAEADSNKREALVAD